MVELDLKESERGRTGLLLFYVLSDDLLGTAFRPNPDIASGFDSKIVSRCEYTMYYLQ